MIKVASFGQLQGLKKKSEASLMKKFCLWNSLAWAGGSTLPFLVACLRIWNFPSQPPQSYQPILCSKSLNLCLLFDSLGVAPQLVHSNFINLLWVNVI